MSFVDRLTTLEFGWRDAVDILLVAVILYQVLMLIRGTRAMQMAIGLTGLTAAYFAARTFDLPALEVLSGQILFYLPFAVIVLFQHEIRKALASFGRNPLLNLFGPRVNDTRIPLIVEAGRQLASRRIGALIVLERTQNLRMYTEEAVTIDAILSIELLVNLFSPNAPLHDGAVVIRRGRVLAAGCLLPLSASSEIPTDFGTRHRAAVGLTEESDAAVVVVSEENGSIAVATEGKLYRDLTPETLERILTGGAPQKQEVA